MQEEVENRSVNLVISTTRLTARTIISGIRIYLNHRHNAKIKHEAKQNEPVHGKQTVKQLIGQNQGVSNIEVSHGDICGIQRLAKKYGVDFAIRKDKSSTPPRYLVFFKARDADALEAVQREYTTNKLLRKERPSILAQLAKLKELVVSIPGRAREKSQEIQR